jgi:hypothetical protein
MRDNESSSIGFSTNVNHQFRTYYGWNREGRGSSLRNVMSSKVTATVCQPCRNAGSARTTCASVFIFTVPRPKGRSTRQTSISTGVPGIISSGHRKRTPLELILVVRRDWSFGSFCPAMRKSRKGRLSLARVYARLSSTGRTACVGTRAIPFGLARVVHDGGSITVVPECADSPSMPAGSPRPESDRFVSFGFRAVRIGLPCSSRFWHCSQTLSSAQMLPSIRGPVQLS